MNRTDSIAPPDRTGQHGFAKVLEGGWEHGALSLMRLAVRGNALARVDLVIAR